MKKDKGIIVSTIVIVGCLVGIQRMQSHDLSVTFTDKIMGSQSAPQIPKQQIQHHKNEDRLVEPENPILKKHFSDASLIAEERRELRAEGVVIKTQIYKTDFKNPLIRIVERQERDSKTGKWIIVDSDVMVADHLMVQKSDSMNERDFDVIVRKAGGEIMKGNQDGLYVVQFDGSQPNALTQMMESLKTLDPGIEEAEPDYIRFLN